MGVGGGGRHCHEVDASSRSVSISRVATFCMGGGVGGGGVGWGGVGWVGCLVGRERGLKSYCTTLS